MLFRSQSQLGAHLVPTWPQLGLQNPLKIVPRPLPKAIFPVKVQTLILHNPPTLLLDFYCPPGSWEAHFRLKIGVFTQHVIRVLLGASSNPLWCRQNPKLGPILGPNMGVTNAHFRS